MVDAASFFDWCEGTAAIWFDCDWYWDNDSAANVSEKYSDSLSASKTKQKKQKQKRNKKRRWKMSDEIDEWRMKYNTKYIKTNVKQM